MTEYGYFLSCEENTPKDLVEQARMAEDAGFTSLWISDHFHPWCEAQGQSPFVWSVIGALARATSLPVQTAVTCPTLRMHPVITAQAAATSAALLGEGRFRLGVGSGEALNEHVLGDRWPPAAVRLEMLEEAVHVMRRLFEGGRVDHRGRHYTVENARLYTLPGEPVPVDVSAFGPAALELAGRIGDGLVAIKPEKQAVDGFRSHGGAGKPVFGGVKVCWGRDREAAIDLAHRRWAVEQLPGELNQVLPTPAHFEQAAQLVPRETVARNVTCGDDVDAHVATLREFADAGFDRVHVSQIGPDQRGFFDFYRAEVLPRLVS
ncbi:LLM class F420-dependent oxidoreductase [Streptomyces cinnamoneus]|uniref:LLM class F420-dependent oxidoreductase n=1 Tax=Streptomyces cinnamoneus TaxID=53446 RepID=A0A2G1XKH6_STRCJ|nr:TIGR03557 family F420-dependent LLM class oxidoreductase [Streptomyces cinnamoneus]PHQ51681.1 LLM class F420-dependent oxidoreductase [Streptomyces cinnamoneus]PPT11930.1 TIGR03557 family F420-dependent LLM class oxidoreductase [Streptomyces cinnamoneus]